MRNSILIYPGKAWGNARHWSRAAFIVCLAFCLWARPLTQGAAPPPSPSPIGSAVATFDLVPASGSPANKNPYGLAFDFVHFPHRLYVSDVGLSGSDNIFAYQ